VTVELIQIDEVLLFIGFGIFHGKLFCKVLAKFIAHKLKYSPELCKCVCCSCCLVFNATEMNHQLCSVQKKRGVYRYRCRNSEVDMMISANVIAVT